MRGQTSIEYIFLIAFGLLIVGVGFTLAFYIKNFTDSALGLVAITRNETISMLLR